MGPSKGPPLPIISTSIQEDQGINPYLSSTSLTLNANDPKGRMQDHKILHSYLNLKLTPLPKEHGNLVNGY